MAIDKTANLERIRVKRAFFIGGVTQNVGDVISVTSVFAREMVAAKKAEIVLPEPVVELEGATESEPVEQRTARHGRK